MDVLIFSGPGKVCKKNKTSRFLYSFYPELSMHFHEVFSFKNLNIIFKRERERNK